MKKSSNEAMKQPAIKAKKIDENFFGLTSSFSSVAKTKGKMKSVTFLGLINIKGRVAKEGFLPV